MKVIHATRFMCEGSCCARDAIAKSGVAIAHRVAWGGLAWAGDTEYVTSATHWECIWHWECITHISFRGLFPEPFRARGSERQPLLRLRGHFAEEFLWEQTPTTVSVGGFYGVLFSVLFSVLFCKIL